jgi:hypothetical protein
MGTKCLKVYQGKALISRLRIPKQEGAEMIKEKIQKNFFEVIKLK